MKLLLLLFTLLSPLCLLADVLQSQLLSNDYSVALTKYGQLVFKQDQEKYLTYLNQSFDYEIKNDGLFTINERSTILDQVLIQQLDANRFKVQIKDAKKIENLSGVLVNQLNLFDRNQVLQTEYVRLAVTSEGADYILTLQPPAQAMDYLCLSFENNFTFFRGCIKREKITQDFQALGQFSNSNPQLILDGKAVEQQGTVLLQNMSQPIRMTLNYEQEAQFVWTILKRYPLFIRIDRDFENKKYIGFFYDFTMENRIWKSDMESSTGSFYLKNNDLIEVKQEFSLSDEFFKNKEKYLKFGILRVKKKAMEKIQAVKKEKLTQFYLSVTNSSLKRTDDTFEAELFSKMNFGFSFYHQTKLFNQDWVLGGSYDQMQVLDSTDSILIQNKSNNLMAISADMWMSVSENLSFTAGLGFRDHVLFATNSNQDSVAVTKILLPEISGQGILRIPVSDEFLLVMPLRLSYSLGGSADGQNYGSSILMTLGYRFKYITENLDYIFGGDSILATRNVNNYPQKSNSGKFYLGIGYDF